MKKILFAAGLMLLAFCASAQVTPEAFLGGLPGIPGSVCSTSDSEVDQFLNQISIVKGQIKEYSDRLSNIASARKDEMAGNAMAAVSARTGISQEEMMKLANMSEEEQEKWGQEYAARQMAAAKAGKPAGGVNQAQAKKSVALSEEKLRLKGEVDAFVNRMKALSQEIALRDTLESRKRDARIKPIMKAWENAPLEPGAMMLSTKVEDGFRKQIHECHADYCREMSPLQLDFITKYLTGVKALLPTYRRLAQLDNEIAGEQLNIDNMLQDENIYAITAVEGYADFLRDAYKYRSGKFDQ